MKKIVAVLYGIVFFWQRELFFEALEQTLYFLKEMLQVLPAVMVLSGLIAVWVPRKIIERTLGKGAGIKGALTSLTLGSLSAGPIYAAFPAALVLFQKGASVSSLVIIISSWAVVKLPMLLVEINFLGASFALTRYCFTVPGIFLMAFLTQKILPAREIQPDASLTENQDREALQPLVDQLPGRNCGACGYTTCLALAEAVAQQKEPLHRCVFLEPST